MKKLIAAMLALMLLLSAAALAEDNAAVMMVSNVNVQYGDQVVEIQDLTMSLALDNIDNLPSIALLIDGAGEPLATAVAQLTSKQVNFAVDGMGYGYFAEIPEEQRAQLAQIGDEGLAMLVPSIVPMLDQVVLPTFQGVDIPKMDMTELLSGFITNSATGEFEIPVEAVNSLLDQVLQMAKEQGRNLEQIEAAIQALEEMRASGMGIAIHGTIDDNGATQKVVGNISLVSGEEQPADVAALTITSSQNSWELGVSIIQGIPMNVLTAALVSRPSEARIDFNLNVLGGVSLSMALFTEDGLQKLTFDLAGLGDSANLEFACGNQGGSDILSFSGKVTGSTMALDIKTAMGADGVRTGTLVASLERDGNVTGLSGDITMYTCDDLDLSGITMPTDLRPVDQMDDAAQQEFQQAFAPVTDYIAAHAVPVER